MSASLVLAARDALEALEALSPLGPNDPVVMALHAAIEEESTGVSKEALRLRRVVRAMLSSLTRGGRSVQEEVDLCELEGWEYIDGEISLEALRALAEIESEEGA